MPRVFISYAAQSEARKRQVALLAEQLRQDGVDAIIDLYVRGSPEEGWGLWMENQVTQADFVLLICTEDFRRKAEASHEPSGVNWEAMVVRTLHRRGRLNARMIIAVLLDGGTSEMVPTLAGMVAFIAGLTATPHCCGTFVANPRLFHRPSTFR
ncbi:MAG: TIR domain-containing protein [Deltaproteobacteria bacterium]|nr:TIR domain-containing protein [Deltaproteobacteria bacterium]